MAFWNSEFLDLIFPSQGNFQVFLTTEKKKKKNLIYMWMFLLLFYFIILQSCNMSCSFYVIGKRGMHLYFFVIVIFKSPRSCLAKWKKWSEFLTSRLLLIFHKDSPQEILYQVFKFSRKNLKLFSFCHCL